MLARFAKLDVRPTLLGQIQIHPGWREVDELLSVVKRQTVMRFAFEIF